MDATQIGSIISQPPFHESVYVFVSVQRRLIGGDVRLPCTSRPFEVAATLVMDRLWGGVYVCVCDGDRLSHFLTARTRNRHTTLQLAHLASADISWLRGIWKSPCWWTSHAAVHLGVRLSVYFGVLVCVPVLHKHSLANVMQLSKGTTCKPIQLINSCAQPSRGKRLLGSSA